MNSASFLNSSLRDPLPRSECPLVDFDRLKAPSIAPALSGACLLIDHSSQPSPFPQRPPPVLLATLPLVSLLKRVHQECLHCRRRGCRRGLVVGVGITAFHACVRERERLACCLIQELSVIAFLQAAVPRR